MRFRQLQKKSNVVLKRKMYKSGKNWVIKSSLAIISGLTLFGVSQTINVKADTVPVGQENTANNVKANTVPGGQVVSDKTLTDDSVTENTSGSPELPTNSGGKSTITSDNPQQLPVNPVQEKQPIVRPKENIEESYQKFDINDSQSDADQEEKLANSLDVSKKAMINTAASPVQVQSDDTVSTLDPEQSGDFGVHWYTDKGTLHLGSGTLASAPYEGGPWSDGSESSVKLRKNITKIVFDGQVKAGNSLNELFSRFSNLTEIDNLPFLDTSDTTVFSSMFQGDAKLEKMDPSQFNTSSATSLSGLFYGDKALTSLDVSGYDVSNVTDFSQMFSYCNHLKDINISNWNMAQATDFERMFDSDELMESVELPDSITSTKVKSDSKMDFDYMFTYCTALKSLDLSNLNMDFSNITAQGMLNTVANTDYANITGSLTELSLSSINNLVSSDLSTSLRDSDDRKQYASGWKVVKTDDGVIPLGTEKETYLLDTIYNGVTNNGTKTTWQLMFKDYIDFTVRYIGEGTSKELTSIPETRVKQGPFTLRSLSSLGVSAEGYLKDFQPAPIQVDSSTNGQTIDVTIPVYVAPVYAPMNFNIIEKDTNDKLINEIDLKIPVGKPLQDTSQVDKISSKPFILKTDDSGDKYSYIEIIDDEGKSEEPIPIDKKTADVIGSDNAQDLTNFFLKNSFSNGADPSQSNWTYVIHTYYEPEKTHSGGSNSGSSSSSSGNESIPESNIEDKEQTIATYADKSNVKIYDTDGNELTNRVISADTGWFSDEILTLNGQKYYRVATDQWLKADDAYVYVAEPTLVRVYQDVFGGLVKAEGNPVTDRELKSGTDWKSDRYAYINGAKYYRVATNEFVSADQVYEYKNVNETLTTKSVVSLYNERGQKLSNELPVNATYKIDRVVVNNGQAYYRVAENEFVIANDDIILN